VVRYTRRRAAHDKVAIGDAMAEAVAMFVLPQLEGLGQSEAKASYEAVRGALGHLCSQAGKRELHARFEDALPHAELSP
jgi:hypothetical protein